jgi:hypothetical protein
MGSYSDEWMLSIVQVTLATMRLRWPKLLGHCHPGVGSADSAGILSLNGDLQRDVDVRFFTSLRFICYVDRVAIARAR